MAKKCIACEYFNNEEGKRFGKCILHYSNMFPDETCEDFENKAKCSNNHSEDKIHELEMRIEKLEKIIWKHL